MTEANQNFSKACKTADKYGKAIIIKNNKPKYLLIDISNEIEDELSIDKVADEILQEHIKAFEELAK